VRLATLLLPLAGAARGLADVPAAPTAGRAVATIASVPWDRVELLGESVAP